jgi:hypothetical protein
MRDTDGSPIIRVPEKPPPNVTIFHPEKILSQQIDAYLFADG